MRRFHVKKNDEVVVLAGSEKGKRGRVISVNGKKQRVIVEGEHQEAGAVCIVSGGKHYQFEAEPGGREAFAEYGFKLALLIRNS